MACQLTVWVLVLLAGGPLFGAQSRPAQNAGLLAPLEPPTSAPYVPPTAQESALLQHLIAQAQQEAVADTELLPLVGQALKSSNPHVRANAFASVQVAMMALRATPGARSASRRAVVSGAGLVLALDGLRDEDGAVRRYALTTIASLDLDAAQRDHVKTLCATLFERDPDPMVRVASLEWLLGRTTGTGTDRTLIERAVADRSPSVKGAGFLAMWMRQVPGFLPYTLGKLHDETDPLTRITAAAALLNVLTTDPSVVDAVSARLALETDPVVRQRLAGTVSTMRETLARAKKPGANQ